MRVPSDEYRANVTSAEVPVLDGCQDCRDREVRSGHGCRQRPLARPPRLRFGLDRQAYRHSRTPARRPESGHVRPLRRSRQRPLRQDRHSAAKDCDLLVLGTFTPDMSFPSTACLVQDRLGMVGPAIEVEAACAGFMYALITAAAYVKAGLSDRALVIGGDTNSRVLNPDDIKTYPLFGDGAGAVFVEPGRPDQGILAYSMGAEGQRRPAAAARSRRQPQSADAGTDRRGQALHVHGRPRRLPLGRRYPLRHDPGRAQGGESEDRGRRSLRRCIRRTSASSTPRSTCCTSRDRRSSTTSRSTGTLPPVRFRSPSMKPRRRAG